MERIDELIDMFEKANCPKEYKQCPLYIKNGCDYFDGWCNRRRSCAFAEAAELLREFKAIKEPENTSNPGEKDMVNHPNHYTGKIEVIDYIKDKLTPQGFTEYCGGNVLKYVSRWRKKDGVQDLKKAKVYLEWMIESAEKEDA